MRGLMNVRTASWLRIGHRGAPRIAPANTMPSFVAAFELGCDWVECDCRASRDGVIVLSHDDAVKDANGQTHAVAECAAQDLAALDLGGGAGVATLEELVAWAVGRVGIMADIKTEGFERQIGELLAPIPPKDKVAPGAGEESRRRFRALFPDLPLSLSLGRNDGAELDRRLPTLETNAVTLEHPLVTPERLAACRQRGIAVYAWTVDDPDTIRALAAMGVDGIISNRADRLAEEVAAESSVR
jgi:glycerophosphoryl diester phosphodiesterase